MRRVISASRRTDIPAFHTDWFIRRLAEGYVVVKNPWSGKPSVVSLKPGDVHSVVFWSKDYSPLLPRLEEVEKYSKNLFFHFTITGLPAEVEPRTPPTVQAAGDLAYLSERYSPDRVVWRFDPVVVTKELPFESFEERFALIAEKLRGKVKTCYTSFATPYRKAAKKFKSKGLSLAGLPEEQRKGYARRLGNLAERYGITLYSCCDRVIISDKVREGSCIDGALLAGLATDPGVSAEKVPTRAGCGCTRSVDIGSYDACGHGCLYCYANSNHSRASEAAKNMDPGNNGLGFNHKDPSTGSLF